MAIIKTPQKSTRDLNRFTNIVAAVLQVEALSLKGFDIENKETAAYLAIAASGCSLQEIGNYYNISEGALDKIIKNRDSVRDFTSPGISEKYKMIFNIWFLLDGNIEKHGQ
tara:strand:+ start:24817 stop:25149 length:333 start_codon:yes stop_codon:yes gene_type:complete